MAVIWYAFQSFSHTLMTAQQTYTFCHLFILSVHNVTVILKHYQVYFVPFFFVFFFFIKKAFFYFLPEIKICITHSTLLEFIKTCIISIWIRYVHNHYCFCIASYFAPCYIVLLMFFSSFHWLNRINYNNNIFHLSNHVVWTMNAALLTLTKQIDGICIKTNRQWCVPFEKKII